MGVDLILILVSTFVALQRKLSQKVSPQTQFTLTNKKTPQFTLTNIKTPQFTLTNKKNTPIHSAIKNFRMNTDNYEDADLEDQNDNGNFSSQ